MSALVHALNTFIEADLGFKASLCAFEGKKVTFRINNIEQLFTETFTITHNGFCKVENASADLTISGRPIKLLDYALAGFPENPQKFDIQILGDMDFARDMMLSLKTFRIDWERLVAMLSFEQCSVVLAEALPRVKALHSKNKSILENALSRFLQAELKVLPSKIQCLDFNQDLTILRQDVDRFEAKLNLILKAQHDI